MAERCHGDDWRGILGGRDLESSPACASLPFGGSTVAGHPAMLNTMSSIASPFISGTCSSRATAIAILMSVRYLETEHENHGEYYALMLLSVAGMMCMAAGFDIVLIFIGLELMAISTYVLVGFLRRDRRSNEAALKYLLLGRVFLRHLCLRIVADVRPDRQHQPGRDRKQAACD